MWTPIVITMLCTKQYLCLDLIDLPENYGSEDIRSDSSENENPLTPDRGYNNVRNVRRFWLGPGADGLGRETVNFRAGGYEDEKDENLKSKITTLVQQTLHDTERKMKTVQFLKEKYREQVPYRAGFILSLVKKSREALNELFNLAVKHRDDWKALQQMQVFENIVHTNVDTTNLVRQLVEIHIQHLNATSGDNTHGSGQRKRVVLL